MGVIYARGCGERQKRDHQHSVTTNRRPSPSHAPAPHNSTAEAPDDRGFSGAQVYREYPMAVCGLSIRDSSLFAYCVSVRIPRPFIDRIQPRGAASRITPAVSSMGCVPAARRVGSEGPHSGPQDRAEQHVKPEPCANRGGAPLSENCLLHTGCMRPDELSVSTLWSFCFPVPKTPGPVLK